MRAYVPLLRDNRSQTRYRLLLCLPPIALTDEARAF